MKHDDFLRYLYSFSTLSHTTKKIYMGYVSRCCRWVGVQHCLDVSPEQLDHFRLWLMDEKKYSLRSDTIVYNAFRHTYTVLLPQVDNAAATQYARTFRQQPRQAYKLPESVDEELFNRFFDELPNTAAGNIIRMMYDTGKPFSAVTSGGDGYTWKCSRGYAATVCRDTARKVGLPVGFGLSGVRSAGIMHRLRNMTSQNEIEQIRLDAEMSHSQFARYRQAVGL